MKEKIELQRSKVKDGNKWESMDIREFPESLEKLKGLKQELKEKAVRLEEKYPNYEYRVVCISDTVYRTGVTQ